MDAAAELGRISEVRTTFSQSIEMSRPRETKFSGANADRKILIFPVQLTTCRIGNLTRLIYTLAICLTLDGF